MTMQVVLKVSRNDELTWSEYRLDADDQTTVVELLEAAQFVRDRTLTYRHSCHHGSCGSCACIINGKEALACMTAVGKLGTEVITVEPLSKFPRIGDLSVDISSMINAAPGSLTYLREDEFHSRDEYPRQRFEDCIECGACMSACPLDDEFIGPAPLAAINRELQKGGYRDPRILEAALRDDGAPACKNHFACSRVCPSSVYPGRHIQQLKGRMS